MEEARSQQAASLTEFNWLGYRFPVSNPKSRVSILKGLTNFFLTLFNSFIMLKSLVYLYNGVTVIRYLIKIIYRVSSTSLRLLFFVPYSAQELEKELQGPTAESLPVEKKLTIFDKLFTAYHDARNTIRSDLVSEFTSHLLIY